VQLELQQTLSTQKPLAQASVVEQVAPTFPLGRQTPALQYAVSMQPADVAQELAHPPLAQRKMPQSALLLGVQVPQPSHAVPVTTE
jgi:hypothetical protein